MDLWAFYKDDLTLLKEICSRIENSDEIRPEVKREIAHLIISYVSRPRLKLVKASYEKWREKIIGEVRNLLEFHEAQRRSTKIGWLTEKEAALFKAVVNLKEGALSNNILIYLAKILESLGKLRNRITVGDESYDIRTWTLMIPQSSELSRFASLDTIEKIKSYIKNGTGTIFDREDNRWYGDIDKIVRGIVQRYHMWYNNHNRSNFKAFPREVRLLILWGSRYNRNIEAAHKIWPEWNLKKYFRQFVLNAVDPKTYRLKEEFEQKAHEFGFDPQFIYEVKEVINTKPMQELIQEIFNRAQQANLQPLLDTSKITSRLSQI